MFSLFFFSSNNVFLFSSYLKKGKRGSIQSLLRSIVALRCVTNGNGRVVHKVRLVTTTHCCYCCYSLDYELLRHW